MNAEYAANSCKDILENYLGAEIAVIEAESSAVVNAPSPAAFLFGERDPSNLTEFPSILIKPDMSFNKDDQDEFEERTLMIDIICWIVEFDEELLNRFVMRYADAVERALQKKERWANYLHSPKMGNVQYSGIYDTDHGIAMGCMVSIQISIVND